MRVVLADEQTLVRAGIKRLMESISLPLVEVVGETDDGQMLLELAGRLRPDLVVTEIALAGMTGLEAAQQIHRHYPDVKLMFLSGRIDPLAVRQAMQYGAVGYVVKDAEPVELELALRAISKGQHYLSPRVSGAAFERQLRSQQLEGDAQLSPRQRQVLRLMARGKSTKEIAALMGVSVKTVETHRARMAQILGLYGVNALMRFAIKTAVESGELSLSK